MTIRSPRAAHCQLVAALALAALLPVVFPGTAPAQDSTDPTAVQPPAFPGDDQKLLYYWGTTFGDQLDALRISDPAELKWILKGVTDGAAGEAPDFDEEYSSLLNNYLARRNQQANRAEAEDSRAYLARMAREDGAILTDDGLVYRELRKGHGPRPTSTSRVRVHYTGTLRSGRVFDSSRERGRPFDTPLDRVIPCWSHALPLMQVGGEARISCPSELAYGERGNARIPGGSALTFEVELIEILK